jgi:hypothetical protein
MDFVDLGQLQAAQAFVLDLLSARLACRIVLYAVL